MAPDHPAVHLAVTGHRVDHPVAVPGPAAQVHLVAQAVPQAVRVVRQVDPAVHRVVPVQDHVMDRAEALDLLDHLALRGPQAVIAVARAIGCGTEAIGTQWTFSIPAFLLCLVDLGLFAFALRGSQRHLALMSERLLTQDVIRGCYEQRELYARNAARNRLNADGPHGCITNREVHAAEIYKRWQAHWPLVRFLPMAKWIIQRYITRAAQNLERKESAQ